MRIFDHSRETLVKTLESGGAVLRGNACRCIHPDHADHKASAGIYDNDAGEWRYKCQSCGWGGDAADVAKLLNGGKLAAGNGHNGKPVPLPKTGKSWPKIEGAIEAARRGVARDENLPLADVVYAHTKMFHTEQGEEHAAEIRFNLPTRPGEKQEKTIRPVHKVAGGWAVGDPPGLWPPYRVCELKGAERVNLTEGAKAADAAVSVGLVATASAHGALSPHKTDWAALVRAGVKGVCIFPDNDSAGEDYKTKITGILTKLGIVVRWVYLPDLPPKGDMADFTEELRDGQDAETIRAEIEALVGAAAVVKDDPTADKLRLRIASEVEVVPVVWTWPSWAPESTVGILQGLPGGGKSTAAADMATRLTRGLPLPDGSVSGGPGDVVWLAFEEPVEQVVVARFKQQGADLSRIIFPDVMTDAGPLPMNLTEHLALLGRAVDMRPKTRWVVFDPLSGALGPDVNPNDNGQVRRVLAPLSGWAAARRVFVLGLNHLAKAGSGHSVLRGLGAGAFNQVARAIWQIGTDPNMPDVQVLAPVKCSLCRPPKSLSFTIGEGGVVNWSGHSEVTADSMLLEQEHDGGDGKIDKAAEWLRGRLFGQGEVPVVTIKGDAEGEGLNWWTIKEAKDRLGVRARKDGFSKGWFWALVGPEESKGGNHA